MKGEVASMYKSYEDVYHSLFHATPDAYAYEQTAAYAKGNAYRLNSFEWLKQTQMEAESLILSERIRS